MHLTKWFLLQTYLIALQVASVETKIELRVTNVFDICHEFVLQPDPGAWAWAIGREA